MYSLYYSRRQGLPCTLRWPSKWIFFCAGPIRRHRFRGDWEKFTRRRYFSAAFFASLESSDRIHVRQVSGSARRSPARTDDKSLGIEKKPK